MLPCLAAMSVDCDSNIFQMHQRGKLAFVLKYFERAVQVRDSVQKQHALQQQQQQSLLREDARSSTLSDDVTHIHRLSQMIPAELWSTAVVTLSVIS